MLVTKKKVPSDVVWSEVGSNMALERWLLILLLCKDIYKDRRN